MAKKIKQINVGNETYDLAGTELGETSTTAYRGDRGKTAYDHSQATGNPHNTAIADISGLQTILNTIPTITFRQWDTTA